MLDYKVDSVAFNIDNATWKCSKCGNLNSSKGNMEIFNIVSQGDAFVNSIKNDPNNPLIEAPWKYVTDKIVSCPENSSRWIKNYLNLDNCKCTNCGHSEPWSRVEILSKLLSVALILLLGGLAIFILMGHVVGLFASTVGALILAASYLEKNIGKEKTASLTKESFPRITLEKEAFDAIYVKE